ncbi:16S rRNA (adenine(1518)-N(6)/adenine(1519)-N(6))-dimethyltransferase RsmA [Oceanibacterium hippocampi]|uniref:Ribosomal RNA small subunit methyltransferase A n=1 Tax=Oceanibacterium hippocampi TaxID=745714 RepID=A0A1Y5SYZ1_9PROT|nr:16S rRNA (adenine(1518)-N(6)/adenine(1519)-N(6))-dimethyltransferase RsmA [Oceanibacterium hippocampi]SLN48292.1 Ribosomal RNA small subunit methyltransferase A [Oceanibacterium hippocampi]
MAEDDSPDLPPLRDVIARHQLAARRSLGQNFLLDLNLTRRIARGAGTLAGRTVIEVGPGPGGLTRALLLEGAAEVVAIEKDERCLAALGELADAFPGRLRIVPGDALAIAERDLAPPPHTIVANLPYNISTVLLLKWLGRPADIAMLVLMFQREVADRLVAAPRSKSYGRLSVFCQWLCTVEKLFDVSPQAFTPPPKVTSTVVRLTPRPAPLFPATAESLQMVVAAAFGQRRKMLRSSLKTLGLAPEPLLEAAGIAPEKRAEEIDVEGFCALARAYDAARQ